MTQFAGGFFEGPKEVAKAYNIIQKFIVEHNRHYITSLMQNESLARLGCAKATAFPMSLALASTFTPVYIR